MERNLKVNDIATLLSKHPVYIRNLARQGKLPASKNGGQWIFNKEEVLEFFNITVQQPHLINRKHLINKLEEKRLEIKHLNEFEFYQPSDVRMLLRFINDPEIETAFNRLPKLRVNLPSKFELYAS